MPIIKYSLVFLIFFSYKFAKNGQSYRKCVHYHLYIQYFVITWTDRRMKKGEIPLRSFKCYNTSILRLSIFDVRDCNILFIYMTWKTDVCREASDRSFFVCCSEVWLYHASCKCRIFSLLPYLSRRSSDTEFRAIQRECSFCSCSSAHIHNSNNSYIHGIVMNSSIDAICHLSVANDSLASSRWRSMNSLIGTIALLWWRARHRHHCRHVHMDLFYGK